MDRLGSHPALQPPLHPLPCLVGGDIGRGRLHHRRVTAPPRRHRRAVAAGGRPFGGGTPHAEGCLRHCRSRDEARPADVHGHQRHPHRRCRLRRDEEESAPHGFPFPRRIDGLDGQGTPSAPGAAAHDQHSPVLQQRGGVPLSTIVELGDGLEAAFLGLSPFLAFEYSHGSLPPVWILSSGCCVFSDEKHQKARTIRKVSFGGKKG